MGHRRVAVWLLALAGTAPLASAFGANQAGIVKLAEGDARIATAGIERSAKAGDMVSEGDALITGANGEMHIAMQDAGFMVVRPNTRFQIVSYTADADERDSAVFKLISGGVRSITGWIGKFNPRRYQIRTASATVGIHGTDHETRYIPEGSSEGDAGTYDRVYAGETYLETPAGRIEIAPNQVGYLSTRANERARRLPSIPVFFRPGAHEVAIGVKHAQVQQQVDQRREERRKALVYKRAATGETGVRLEALRKDMQAARELREENERIHAAIENDVKWGRLSRDEMRERREALGERRKAYKKAQDSIDARRKDFGEAADLLEEKR